MKTKELPDSNKFYKMIMTHGESHIIDGQTKMNIMNSQSQFVELEDGSCINKSCIVQIKFDHDLTKDKYLNLSNSERNKLIIAAI